MGNSVSAAAAQTLQGYIAGLSAELRAEVEAAMAEEVTEDCVLPSAEELADALKYGQEAEEAAEEAEEDAPAGSDAVKAALEKKVEDGKLPGDLGEEGEGGAAARPGEGGAGNYRRQKGGRRKTRSRKGRGRRVQRGGALGDYLRAFFRFTCGRAGVVVRDEYAQQARGGAVAAAIADVENNNPAYMEQVRGRWKDWLSRWSLRALTGAVAIDLAGPQFTVQAVTFLLGLLSNFIPNVTLYGAAAGLLSGGAAAVGVGAPLLLTALNAYLGISLTRVAFNRLRRGAAAIRRTSPSQVVEAARARIAEFRTAPAEQRDIILADGVARVNNAWLTFLSDVLFFGNQDMLFRIIGVPTPAEQQRDAEILAQIRAEAAAAGRAREAAEAEWRRRVEGLLHPSRQAAVASERERVRVERQMAERFARADAAVQAGEAAAARSPAARAAQVALVAAGRVNAGVGPNAAPAGNGEEGGAGSVAGSAAARAAGGLAGLSRVPAGLGLAYAGNNLGILAGGPRATLEEISNSLGLGRGAGGGIPSEEYIVAAIHDRFPQLIRDGKNTQWKLNAAKDLLASERAAAAARDAAPASKVRSRAGSASKAVSKKPKPGAGGGEGKEERRNSTMMGGRRRKSRKVRKTRKGHRKH
jgi:hypothetical protein